MDKAALWLVPRGDPQIEAAAWAQALPILTGGKEPWEKFRSVESMYSDFVHGVSQLWILHTGALVHMVGMTEVVDYPKRRVLRISALAGHDVKGKLHMLDAFEDWAAKNGVHTMMIAGRPGWERVLAPHGYEKDHIVLTKDVMKKEMH